MRRRLTDEDVRSIRERALTGPYGIQRRLAREYGVHEGYIAAIVHGVSRATAPGPVIGYGERVHVQAPRKQPIGNCPRCAVKMRREGPFVWCEGCAYEVAS